MNNRTYIADLNGGDRVQVLWVNGVQRCSLIPKGEKVQELDMRSINKQAGKVAPVSKAEQYVASTHKKGDVVLLSWKQLRNAVDTGNKVFTKAGKSIPCTKRAILTPDKQVKVLITEQGKIKHYNLI